VTFPVPELDDRSFVDLVLQARERAREACPGWTDLSVHDPGMALIEVFAHLTEVMLYRLNRLPEKSYLTFLNLIGLTRRPPRAAWVELTFQRDVRGPEPAEKPAITIPAGTRVSTGTAAAQQATFVTTEAVVIAADTDSVTVRAHHCALVDAELLGEGTGRPGQRLSVKQPPIVSTTEPIDLLLGVQITDAERERVRAAREHAGKVFEIWQPVHSFADTSEHDRAYLVDRSTGAITFAPEVAGRVVPPPDAEIRAWYRTGGGATGNVGAGQLSSIEPRIEGVTVSNPNPAQGGRDLEDVDDALSRGPYEFFSLQRAVTARDYEVLATASSGGVARARAFTRVAIRPFARPGEVEVVLVPEVPQEERADGRLTLPTLLSHQVEEARARTATDLAGRGALGTTCVTSWANYKDVSVKGTVVVRPEEDPAAVRERIHQRLYRTISPLPTEGNPVGWRFGDSLRASTVYRLLEQAEPGVRYVEDVEFVVGEAPDGQLRAVTADPYQADTWYCGSGEIVFRSVNDGKGWEPVGRFPGEEVRAIVPAPRAVRPGMIARRGTVALATRRAETGGSRVYVSTDLGETWRVVTELGSVVNDIAWIEREGAAALLLASDNGLYELPLLAEPGAPQPVVIDSADPDRALYAVEAVISEQGSWGVIAAAQAKLGIYLSVEGGRPGTFGNIGPSPAVDSRCLGVQISGPSTVLWVGTGEPDAAKPGSGCLRTRLFEADVQWERLTTGWVGGTCWDLAFHGKLVLAATQSSGVLSLEATASQPSWTAPDVNCGLPLRDRARFEAALTVDSGGGTVMAGGTKGVYRSVQPGRWSAAANRVTTDEVTIPDTWLLCSGEHKIKVVGGYAQTDD
jgi:hypothetical protein